MTEIEKLRARCEAAERSRDEAREALRECYLVLGERIDATDAELAASRRARRVLSGEKEGAPTSPPAPEEDK